MTKQQSFFDNLKKIFSSTVIVRGEDNKLKIIDLDKIQAYNNLETNRAIDRYGRGYSGANYASSWNTTGDARYRPYNKMDLYKDYDTMDTDPILSTVLDIYSEESSLNNEYDDIITINTENKDLENVLSNLFYDILNIEFNLPIWIRSLVKYGDFFLKMDIVEKIGITNVYPLSPYGVDRFESPDGTNIRFTYDKSLGTGLSPGNNQFYDYEISHFRLISDAYYLPYGRSILEPARRMWKQLILMEDAMLLHRILRAPDRRAFYIDVGNIPPNEVEMYIKKVINETKRIPYMDPNTGQYNLRYNLMSLTDDLYMPVRGNSSGTKIDTVDGLKFTGTEDIEYLRNRMMAALKVP
ncbi:MAG: portal protein, partial [Candidatus Omnitrophica bacterium]|nr:portal protein [Candidatus Omnitrophota bacterium]